MVQNKKNGFTLIELLAIIILLAILALIVIPVIGKIVDEAKKEAFRQTTKGTSAAIERKCDLQTHNNDVITSSYTIENSNVVLGQSINISGKLPTYASVKVDKSCNVQIAAHNNKWCATKDFDEDKVTITSYVEGECGNAGSDSDITEGNDIWDGWINMTLYYPARSTARQWRLGSQGEVRYDENLMWQDYTGSITIPLARVEDVWIRYILEDETIIIPPAGTVLVDIEPDSYGTDKKVSTVNVKINYDKDATVKEYRVGNSGWMPYAGEFTVTENVMIEARASKPDNVYDADGNLVVKRNAVGRDAVYIGNVGITEDELEAPEIERLDPVESDEVAKVRVTYPSGAVKKIYKVNYGIEENYTSEISVKKNGTYIIAYYYDANGKRSKARAIYIDDTNSGPVIYPPQPPRDPGDPPPVDPTYVIEAPLVDGTPKTQTAGGVTVTVSAPSNANRIYIKEGSGAYNLYTGPINVTDNKLITAYYVTYNGEISEKGYYRVTNITKGAKPAVTINANPYPYPTSYGETSVNVSLTYSNADTVEYSLDGLVYNTYNGAFDITKNCTIYARATNSAGVATTQLAITNIGGYTPPPKQEVLSVDIYASPEPTQSTKTTDKVKIKIDYDSDATKKYYTIGYGTALIPYTAEFYVTSNTTIYAYALSDNGKGSDSKVIDNLNLGIAAPIIVGDPSNGVATDKTKITITYAKNAVTKMYSVNNGPLRNYAAAFDVSNNDEIYAYSVNAGGEIGDATYKVTNVLPQPTTFLIDKGDYFILKLNYPELSKGREYKWTESGTWKAYDPKGILLIKPQYKDKLVNTDGTLRVGIEDDNGNIVDYTNHWYITSSSFTELKEYIFMRWDRTTPQPPSIVLDTLEPAKEVNATIIYSKDLVKRQYKVVDDEGNTVVDWTTYKSPVNIKNNNYVIYARGQDNAEVWSEETIYKVVNIDENQPVIKLTTDLVTATQKLGIKVSVTDDIKVSKVKWAKGILGESYFASGGNEIANNSIVTITENAYYTFYAEDGVGNTQVYTLNVENIDLTPPLINISASPENTVGTTSQITINYGDSTTKEFKIGSSTTWMTYNDVFSINSYTILQNNWQNSDGTVTIFARGKDTAGNEVIVSKKIVNLDLDLPKAPLIVSTSGYAVLTSYGVTLDATTTITYDSRTDIDNYYSVDNGATWSLYTGPFSMANGILQAKSVKKTTGLEVVTNKTLGMPADALELVAYDGSETTYSGTTNKYMLVDSNMQGKTLNVVWAGGNYSSMAITSYIRFLDENKNLIGTISASGSTVTSGVYTIPVGTKWIKSELTQDRNAKLFEIRPSNEPKFTAQNGYATLTADTTKIIREPYQMVTINYFETTVQRLYQIGSTTGEWLTYQDKPIWVNQGQTIYAKGIDQYGNETRIISSYTANVSDAMVKEVFDCNESTYTTLTNQYMLVDSTMQGRTVNVVWAGGNYSTMAITSYIRFLDEGSNVIGTISASGSTVTNGVYTIPVGTKWIKSELTQDRNAKLFEIRPSNEPRFTAQNGYATITADITKTIREPYQMVTINYFETTVQRLYQIGSTTGEWKIYQDQPIKVNQGQTIYAKGIDQYGNETRTISSYTASVSDAIVKEVFDDNESTYTALTNHYMLVDSTMQGKTINVVWAGGNYSTLQKTSYLRFLDENSNVISSVSASGSAITNGVYTVPAGTKYIKSELATGYNPRLYEIRTSNEPKFAAINEYPTLFSDPSKIIRDPYQAVTIDYFVTSVQKLYRIGTTGDWLNYTGSAINVKQGDTIYAKGIDIYGNESRIISSLTANSTDSIPKVVFDENNTTYTATTNQYMSIDSSMIGKNISVVWAGGNYSTLQKTSYLRFLDEDRNVISSISASGSAITNGVYTVPTGTKYIKSELATGYNPRLYEISLAQ